MVAPGGHTQLVIDKEGWEIADWLNSLGIAAFVLKYRLARARESPQCGLSVLPPMWHSVRRRRGR